MKPTIEYSHKLVDDLLTLIPELQTSYDALAMEYSVELTPDDYSALKDINVRYNLPTFQPNLPGLTIVFESILMPYIFKELLTPLNERKLRSIFSWIELLATNGDQHVKNLVGTSFCEPILTTYQVNFPRIYAYLGQQTQTLCCVYGEDFVLKDYTVKLLDC